MSETLFGEAPSISIVIPGTVVSGNRKTRSFAKQVGTDAQGRPKFSARTYTTREAKEFAERVRSIALYEVAKSGWVMPEWMYVSIKAYNYGIDRTNIAKTVEDALQGIIYKNDGHILDGPVGKRKDDRGQRVEVVVRAVDPKDYGYG